MAANVWYYRMIKGALQRQYFYDEQYMSQYVLSAFSAGVFAGLFCVMLCWGGVIVAFERFRKSQEVVESCYLHGPGAIQMIPRLN